MFDIMFFLPLGVGSSVGSYFTFLVFSDIVSVVLFVFVFVFLLLIFSYRSIWLYCLSLNCTPFSFVFFGVEYEVDLFNYYSLFFPVLCCFFLLKVSTYYLTFFVASTVPIVVCRICSYQWGWIINTSFVCKVGGLDCDACGVVDIFNVFNFDGCIACDSDVNSSYDFNQNSFLSYSLVVDSSNIGSSVCPLVLPVGCNILFLTSSTDVIHSFCVDSLGIKIDCVPGRLNSVSSLSFVEGIFYGNCSEFCGESHAFMGMKIEFISIYDFLFFFSINA